MTQNSAAPALSCEEMACEKPARKGPARKGLARKEPTGKETAGKEAAGMEAASKEAIGKEAACKEPAGMEPTGKEPAAMDQAGMDEARMHEAGIEPADPRWAQLRARDKSADGAFVYAVRTTGVFCRPSCASRPARPENVRFYATAADARQAGYRPCKRCRPTETAGGSSTRMQALAAYIAEHADEPLTLARLAAEAKLSPTHLQRAFTAALGVSPKAYQAAIRLAAFKSRLRAGDDILGATFEAGYGSTSRIYEQVDGSLGMTPAAYRAGGAGEIIVHATRDTALGRLMMAATPRGVCYVQFGDTDAALLAGLAQEFPHAERRPATADAAGPLDAWMAALAAHLANGAPRPDLPLDLRGTAFQIRVWRFLLSVKPGGAVSYTEIAAAVGAPKAVRAAGSACGKNLIAVLVPCHRALRADGGLGGYRWGLDRKRALLALERKESAHS